MFFHERDMAKWKERVDRQTDQSKTHLPTQKTTFEKIMLALVWLLVLAMAIGMVMVKSGG